MAIQGPLTITIAAGLALIAASQGFGGVAHPRATIARWIFVASVVLVLVLLTV